MKQISLDELSKRSSSVNSMRIHLLGPSGSGTTTLGKNLSNHFKIKHFDTDDFFWLKTDPPFLDIRPKTERIDLLKITIKQYDSWVLSGSILDWGDFLIPEFNVVIFKYICQEVRIERLLNREKARHGDRILPGNDMHQMHTKFISWAKSYETGGLDSRSKLSHETWMKRLSCKIIRIEEELDVKKELEIVINSLTGYIF